MPVEEETAESSRLPGWLRPDPLHALGALLIVSAVFRAYRLRTPAVPIIFDETFYVNAARIMAGLPVPKGLPYWDSPHGLDPNVEHPPLGKALIEGSMRVFGDNGFGWRLPSLLAGIACIALVYVIARRLSGDEWLAVLAATIFSFDDLVLVHSRTAMLDMPMLAFLLLAVWCWLREENLVAGIAFGIAVLLKEPAIFGLAAIVVLGLGAVAWQRLRERTWDRRALKGVGVLLGSFVVVSLGGLWLLDLAFTNFNTPWAHVHKMLFYGFSLETRHGAATNVSAPWRWLFNQTQSPYFKAGRQITVRGDLIKSYTTIDFEMAMNPVVIGAAPLAVSYVAWRAWVIRDRLSIFVLVWIATNYLVYYPLVLIEARTTYLFYILPTLPALAIAIAQLLRQARLPSAVTWWYLFALLLGFGFLYPFKNLFPI